ncbi:hypothetical protein CBR_g38959 [Chara braunii]|uniref:Uncharacterized protein n=1 Tax=Chara braunii TaxID=69332 RepID=A0A388K0T3_CHABU|nr:hypothetical protein CBR_g38959 [Chara braunii]|eukprot:GBG63648.1 hypothetical protein CBR_g38959 [Chara braunii]
MAITTLNGSAFLLSAGDARTSSYPNFQLSRVFFGPLVLHHCDERLFCQRLPEEGSGTYPGGLSPCEEDIARELEKIQGRVIAVDCMHGQVLHGAC